MHDERVIGPELAEHARDLFPERRRRHAEKDAPDPRGVRERAEDVEDRTDPDLATHRPGVAHRGMETRSEHEPDVRLLDASRDAVGTEIDLHAERLEDVRAAARARRGPVAVFGHPAAGTRHDERGHRGDVEAVRPVAAGADDVDRVPLEDDPHDHVAERRGAARDLIHRLAADVQRRQERAELRRCRLAGHDRGHRRVRLRTGQRPPAGDDADGLTRVQGSSPACACRPRS